MGEASATARWMRSTCSACHQFTASLVATRRIPAGAEITVPSAPHLIGTSEDGPAILVSFDGGSKDG
eukprot:9126726-Heterocapsa_arctica.AAC.1